MESLWVGVEQSYDSERTHLFKDRDSAFRWLHDEWKREKKYAALTETYWKDRDDRSDYAPDVTDIKEGYAGFAEFSTDLDRYFIQEREIKEYGVGTVSLESQEES